MIARDALRNLPPIHEVVKQVNGLNLHFPRGVILEVARSVLDSFRQRALQGELIPAQPEILQAIAAQLNSLSKSSLVPVINATGVVLHTNLGRAPLGSWLPHPGYCNLEYDLETGNRGRRDVHLNQFLGILLGKPAIAVNNGAAATFLALHELAAGFEVIVSRGELIEIGDGFRIPDILSRSGAILREVGTTNRTHIEDYREAINERTRLILRVHPSNFHISGFTAKPALRDLVDLGQAHHIPVYEDLGSGNMIDLKPYGISEPLVTDSLNAGVSLVSFSGDKLLGGPQAGILAGDQELVQRIRRNPLFRAFRLDKLAYQALETTLAHLVLEDWEAIPALRMIRFTDKQVAARSRCLFPNAELIPGESVIGGGSTPDQRIPTTLVVAARENVTDLARALRIHDPPVIARISNDLLVLDLRTVLPEDEPQLRNAVTALPGNVGL